MDPDPSTSTSPLRRLIFGLVLGMIGLLIGMLGTNVMAFRLGVLPTSTAIRTGTATITSCSLTWTTMYECQSSVSWTGDPAPVDFALSTSPVRTVVSSSAIGGTIEVTGRVYRPLTEATQGELVLPSDQRTGRTAVWLLIGLGASIALCVLGFAIGARLSRPKVA